MKQRITGKDLERLARRINAVKKRPQDTHNGATWNVGNHHISVYPSVVCLHEIVCETGSVRDVLGTGYVKRRELYNKMRDHISEIENLPKEMFENI